MKSLPLEEIAQFTDFLFHEMLIEKKGYFFNGLPSFSLIITPKANNMLLSDERLEVLFPYYEKPRIDIFSKSPWRPHCLRFHALDKRRFLPKNKKK